MSDSPGLVDFAIGLVIFVLNLPDGQVLFWGKFKLRKDYVLKIVLIWPNFSLNVISSLFSNVCGL